jgi:exopolysaccharide production protein ExoZ
MLQNTQQYFRSIDVFKILLALIVLGVHLEGVLSSYTLVPSKYVFPLKNVAVPLFFIISGFVTAYQLENKFRDDAGFNPFYFLSRKVGVMFANYYLFLIPCLIVWLFYPTLFNASTNHHTDVFASIFLLPSQPGHLPLINVTWSLTFTLYYYLFNICAIQLFRQHYLFVISLYACIVFLKNEFHIGFANQYLEDIFSIHLLYFFAGNFIAYRLLRPTNNLIPLNLIVVVGIALTKKTNLFAFLIIWVLLEILIYYEFRNKRQYRRTPILQFAVQSSFTLFLSHNLVMGVVKRLWVLYGVATLNGHIFYIALLLILPIAFALGLQWLKNWLNDYLKAHLFNNLAKNPVNKPETRLEDFASTAENQMARS